MDSIIRAHYFVDNGFAVTPLQGKKPILKGWQNYSLEDSRNDTISALQRGKADNFGIITGTISGIVVVDIDLRENGIDNWLNMIQGHQMEETFIVETGSGGYHIYYQYDPRLSSSRKLPGLGIDFKSDGGQVVAPGSVHPDTGNIYTVGLGYVNDMIVIAAFPEFLIPIFSIGFTKGSGK